MAMLIVPTTTAPPQKTTCRCHIRRERKSALRRGFKSSATTLLPPMLNAAKYRRGYGRVAQR